MAMARIHGQQDRNDRHLRGRCRAGHCSGDLSRRERHLHRPGQIRPVEHAVREHVPPPGRHSRHHRAAGCAPGPAFRHEAGVSGRPVRRSGIHDAARPQPAVHFGTVRGVRNAAAGNGESGRRIRPHGTRPEHVHRRVSPPGRRRVHSHAQRPARSRHDARPGVRGRVRRRGPVVGPPADVGHPARNSSGDKPASSSAGTGTGTRKWREHRSHRGHPGRGWPARPAVGLRGVRGRLRSLRDGQRQLGSTGHDR